MRHHLQEVVETVCCEALFASRLPTGSHPGRPGLTVAIADAVRRHGGTRGCVGEMACAYGENPENAASRMRWARSVVRQAMRTGTRNPPEP